jgi:hypothetical protein
MPRQQDLEEDEDSSMPSLVDQIESSSSDEAEDDTDSSTDASMPSLKQGSGSSSSSSDVDSSDSSEVIATRPKKAVVPYQQGQQKSSSQRSTLVHNTNALQQLRYEIKPSTPKNPKLYVVKCTWCDCKMTEKWRRSFLNVQRDEVYGTATLCPGCVQSYEILQEFHIECKYCKMPPPHLGEAPGGTYICEECSIMRGMLPYKKRTTFKTRSLQKGHPIGTPVHLVRMNIGGGGFEEANDSNRGVIVGWMHPFHVVWVEGNAPTDHSCVPIQCLRVMQYNDVTSEEVAVLLPTGEFSSEQGNIKLTSRPQFKGIVNLMQMDCRTIYPRSIPVLDLIGMDDSMPMADYVEEMRNFFDTSNIDIKYCTVPRVLDAWIKVLDLLIGVGITAKMKPKRGDMKIFDSLVFMVLSSKATSQFLVDFLARTPYIGPRGNSMDTFEQGHDFSNHDTLTPDQSHKCYIASLLLGPLRFLFVVSQLEQYSIFWRSLACLPRTPLLIERLVRIVSRESIGEPDGVLLGPYAKPPLKELLHASLEYPLPISTAEIALTFPPFRQFRTPYDEYFGECPPWESDLEDS